MKKLKALTRINEIKQYRLAAGILAILIWLNYINYLLFHSFIELFCIIIALCISLVALNSHYVVKKNNLFIFLGIAYGFVAFFDFIHLLAYEGMGVFGENTANLATQIWIITRYLESISIIVSLICLRKRNCKVSCIMYMYTILSAGLLFSVYTGYFPDCYVIGKLTGFKITSEFIISGSLIFAIILLQRNKDEIEPDVLKLLEKACVFTIVSEITFVFYAAPYDLFNMLGHILKFLSYYFIYLAVFKTDLLFPYNRLNKEIFKREEAEKELAYFFDLSLSGFVIFGFNGKIKRVNPMILQILEKEEKELVGKHVRKIIDEFVHPHDRGKVFSKAKELKNNKSINNFEVRCIYPDGSYRWLTWTAVPNMKQRLVYAVGLDITDKKVAEKERYNLKKLKLIAQMAAGIAHEIRNPLTTIRGFLQILINYKEMEKYRDYFELMLEEIDRSNYIITEFLAMAKIEPANLKKQNINDIITNLLPLLKSYAFKNGMSLETHLERVPNLPLDEQEIQQLIFNLVRNGLEAMKRGGTITIKTFNNRDDEVVLAVRDEGSGIPADVIEKIDIPFFTTKDERLGLGLSICYSIAKRHKATIDIETGEKGTTFYVRFNLKELDLSKKSIS